MERNSDHSIYHGIVLCVGLASLVFSSNMQQVFTVFNQCRTASHRWLRPGPLPLRGGRTTCVTSTNWTDYPPMAGALPCMFGCAAYGDTAHVGRDNFIRTARAHWGEGNGCVTSTTRSLPAKFESPICLRAASSRAIHLLTPAFQSSVTSISRRTRYTSHLPTFHMILYGISHYLPP
jgi:hypothetical protein